MVVLIEEASTTGSLDPAAAGELARLGITTVTVVQDRSGIGFVLEGWAFDPQVQGEEAAALLAGSGRALRVLNPIFQAAISTKGEPRRQPHGGG